MATLTKWTPTEYQRTALEVLQGYDYELSVTALCEEVGIARRTWYEYFDTAAFVKWWTAQFERHFAGRLPRVYAALDKSALGNRASVNTQAAKLLMERFDKGYAPKSRQDVSVDGNLKTYVNVEVERVKGETDGCGDGV